MRRNISDLERVLSIAGGGALVAYALTRGRRQSFAGAALTTGAGLVARGMTGYCPISAAVGRNTRVEGTRDALGGARGAHVLERITIRRPPAELYRFWRDFANLPRFMDHLQDVRVITPTRSEWTAKAPAGTTVTWRADVINEKEPEVIGWQSTADSEVATAGSVRFKPAADGGTEITVHLQYEPPAGRLGSWVAWLFGEEPSQQIRADLEKLKRLLETDAVSGRGHYAARRTESPV